MTLERPAPADLVIDTSALVALLFGEPRAELISDVLDRARGPLMSSANVVELMMVAEGRRGPEGAEVVSDLLSVHDVVTMPVDRHTAAEAHLAWRKYGKGHHRAGLNYGDCFAYALARHAELPLLCVGDDFRHTDLDLALSEQGQS